MRAPRVLGLGLAAWLASQPAWSLRPITPPAPEFPPNHAWLNGAELSMGKLRKRRVVLVAFINTMSMNSVRTIPVLNSWWQRYQLSGLMVIGVHTPDFDFDGDPLAIRTALKRLGVQFPVVLDNDAVIWKKYANEGWPAMYLVNHKGEIVFDRLGEGGYREFELELRDALNRFNRYWAPETLPLVDNLPNKDCYEATPAVYLGSRRGRSINWNATPERGRDLIGARDGETGYKGKWSKERDAIRLNVDNPALNAFTRVIYRGAAGYALVGKAKPGRFFLKQDDIWLHAGNAGPDVEWDDRDRSFVRAGSPRLYSVTRNTDTEYHELTVFPEEPDGRVYGYEFSNFCQVGAKN